MPPTPERQFNPGAALAAWIWPGLGHIVLGQRRRGRLIMFGVLLLFLGGMLVGGIDCVDRKGDRLWFLAQSVCGPIAFAADIANQKYVQALPDDERFTSGRIALNKPNEMGTLFCALAGLMNLIVILDALYATDRPAERKQPEPPRRRAEDATP